MENFGLEITLGSPIPLQSMEEKHTSAGLRAMESSTECTAQAVRHFNHHSLQLAAGSLTMGFPKGRSIQIVDTHKSL